MAEQTLKKQVLSTRIDADVAERVRAIAEENFTDVSTVVGMMIKYTLKQFETKKTNENGLEGITEND